MFQDEHNVYIFLQVDIREYRAKASPTVVRRPASQVFITIGQDRTVKRAVLDLGPSWSPSHSAIFRHDSKFYLVELLGSNSVKLFGLADNGFLEVDNQEMSILRSQCSDRMAQLDKLTNFAGVRRLHSSPVAALLDTTLPGGFRIWHEAGIEEDAIRVESADQTWRETLWSVRKAEDKMK